MVSAASVPTVTLNNGIVMPQIGLGMYKMASDEAETAIKHAIESGYRAFDTAEIYGNEDGVGQAINASGLTRSESFITTKLWNSEQGYDKALTALEGSLKRLNSDYIDLYLIHWPVPKSRRFKESWRAMERLLDEGAVKAIGVSNFKTAHLRDLLADAHVVPAVNQIELHPLLTQLETRKYCEQHGIAIESWSPLMQAGEILSNPIIAKIANIYGKEPAQVILRWHIQSGLIVIPKSSNQQRIKDNISIFNFELSEHEMAQISGLNQNYRIGPDPEVFN